jgi:hypothetical protein
MGIVRSFALAFGLWTGTLASPAAAEDLYTIWSLHAGGDVGELSVSENVPFVELRLRPYRLVRLTSPAQVSRRDQLPAGTFLFLVLQRDGQTAYCTIKDQLLGNAARSLFIPILDRRPCLVDADRDGQFEARFGVFDKYGSALTPSGNLSSARPLPAPAGYESVDPALFPVTRQLSFALDAVDRPEGRRLIVSYDNGSGYVPMVNSSPDSTANRPTALNVAAEILEASGNAARIRVSIDSSQYVIGDSDGAFTVAPLPPYAVGL